jgi:hypothetical protein
MGPPSADQLPAGSSRAAGCGSEGKGNAHCEKALERVDGLACWMNWAINAFPCLQSVLGCRPLAPLPVASPFAATHDSPFGGSC